MIKLGKLSHPKQTQDKQETGQGKAQLESGWGRNQQVCPSS